MIQQGEVYLVNFGKKYNSEISKIRPAVVVQNNFLNRAIKESIYKQVIVIPLTTVAIEDDYRMKVEARDKLERDSFIVTNWICTLDIEHLLLDKGVITTLKENELATLKQKVTNLI